MVATSTAPVPLLILYISPSDKPSKDPHSRDARSPISLINTIIKITGAAAYNRITYDLEPGFHPTQYAYRRSRGADAHLAFITGAVRMHVARILVPPEFWLLYLFPYSCLTQVGKGHFL